jgi:hypothetical protein
MAKKLGILIIHGMGNPEPTYAEGLIRGLERRLGKRADAVDFEACFWSPILQAGQDATWERLAGCGEMAARRTRHWIVSTLGDPPAYLSGFFKEGQPAYGAIHQCVRSSLARLAASLGGARTDKPLMVLAHSLGSVIVSNYIWDSNHDQAVGRDPFEEMRTLTSLITYGRSSASASRTPSCRRGCARSPPGRTSTTPTTCWAIRSRRCGTTCRGR